MKLIFVFLVSLFTLTAFADCNREVQFIGTVKNVEVHANHFSFQLKTGRWFEPSIVCPMWEDEFESAVIEIEGAPALVEGQEISGILVFDQKTKQYKID
jgi:hypothetical protein